MKPFIKPKLPRGGREAIFITTLVFWILEKEVDIYSTFFLDVLRYLSKKLKMDS